LGTPGSAALLPPNTTDAHWARAYATLKVELDPGRIAKFPTRAANQIVKVLHAFEDGAGVPIAGRAEVLRLIGSATKPLPKDFGLAWIREPAGRDILETWLKEAGKVKETDEAAKALLMPVLRVSRCRPPCSADLGLPAVAGPCARNPLLPVRGDLRPNAA
jgi:hypothetical protein